MRLFFVAACAMALMMAGCSAEVSGHADTSGETVPVAVDLSRPGIPGQVAPGKGQPAAPGVDPGATVPPGAR